MPGRNYNDTAFRFGFNNKEKDNEIKAVANSVDFGSRIYDPRLARWLSVDPSEKRIPSFSPYHFASNNPIRFLDPDGKFLLDVHQRITQEAIALFGGKILKEGFFSLRNANFIYGIIGEGGTLDINAGITNPDLFHSGELGTTYDGSLHFDNMNYKQIMNNFSNIQSSINGSIDQYNAGNMSARSLGHAVGIALHSIQDFYSHSNYVELYNQAYPGQTDISKIPTLKEAQSDPRFKAFAALLKTDLKTGTYPGDGQGSHKDMNHDRGAGSSMGGLIGQTKNKKVNWFSRAAERVAKKATVEFLQNVQNKAQ